MSKINPKDRALVAQMAANIAGGIGCLKDVFTNGRVINVGEVAETSVRIAKEILTKIDAPSGADGKEATA